MFALLNTMFIIALAVIMRLFFNHSFSPLLQHIKYICLVAQIPVPMKRSRLFLAFLTLISLHSYSQVEPQFKFYLAFEDAKLERDTVWFVIDSTAHLLLLDSHLGEVGKSPDSLKFTVINGYDSNSNSGLNMHAVNTSDGSINAYMYSFNYKYPVIIKWDTTLLTNTSLPYALKQAGLKNDNYLINENEVDLFQTDSIVLDSFMIGGGWGDHFPLNIFFSKNPKANSIGLTNTDSYYLHIYPNPSTGSIQIEAPILSHAHVTIYSLPGPVVANHTMDSSPFKIDLGELPSGHYILKFEHENTYSYENFIIIR